MSDVEKIKERLSIADVVSTYVKLEKAGINMRARCPFHSEKTPSFFISPARNSFYCFGCGAKGDIFSFVQQFEGLDFPGALTMLAARAGVQLTRRDPKEDDERTELHKILESATSFYEHTLRLSEEAQAYLLKRGANAAIQKLFRVGYAKPEWRSLFEQLRKGGYSEASLMRSGLFKKTDKGFYDLFRGRIMFPIADSSGRVVAFSGRVFGERPKTARTETIEEAKYVNSPETPLFSKSRILFGFDKAKTAIRKNDFSIVVEGQMDLLMSHQEGFPNTVALSGTALTEGQLTLLKRLSDNILFAFDSDKAGILSSGRSARLALAAGMDVKVAALPQGVDPADLILKNPDDWRKAIRESKHIIDFYLGVLLERSKGDRRAYRKEVREVVLPFVAEMSNKIDQAHFVSRVAGALGLGEGPIWEEVAKVPVQGSGTRNAAGREAPAATASPDIPSRRERIARKLMGILRWQEKVEKPLIDVKELQTKMHTVPSAPEADADALLLSRNRVLPPLK